MTEENSVIYEGGDALDALNMFFTELPAHGSCYGVVREDEKCKTKKFSIDQTKSIIGQLKTDQALDTPVEVLMLEWNENLTPMTAAYYPRNAMLRVMYPAN